VSPAILRTILAGAATATVLLAVAPGCAFADAASGAAGDSTVGGSLSTTVGGPLLADTGTVLPEGAPPLPSYATAQSFVLAEANTGTVLAARDPHGRYAPGGIQKLLTDLTLIPKLDPGDKLVAEADHLGSGGRKAGLKQGAEYSVEDLLYGMLLASGDDAANVLIDSAPGGSTIGLAAMRAEAKRLQANDTLVVNATGSDAQGQVTSAYDTALAAREGLRNGDLARYVSTEQHVAQTSHGPLTWTNDNKLLGKYPGTVGMKSGETAPAGGTYVGAVTRDGRTLLLVLLASADKVAPQAMEMFDWAFALPTDIEPIGDLVEPLASPATSFVTTASALQDLEAGDSDGAASGDTGAGSGTDADQSGSGSTEGSSEASGESVSAAASSGSGGLGFGTEATLSLLLVAFAGVAILLLSARAVPTARGPRPVPASAATGAGGRGAAGSGGAGPRPVRREAPRQPSPARYPGPSRSTARGRATQSGPRPPAGSSPGGRRQR
jgi:D-alanyl-D-alanine carboxypeptidase (penicillin-binding protein 5/6)